MNRLKRFKRIRLHHEGTHALVLGFLLFAAIDLLFYLVFTTKIPFCGVTVVLLVVYGVMVNFFRCPIRVFGKSTEKVVVAPADGKIVVIEEVEENEYFHDKRIMVSIFMSLFNVHANWYPVDGTIKMMKHQNGKYMKAWLPKASLDNERSSVVIETPEGTEILVRQIAGAVARRIVTYAEEGEVCYIDEHLGFIKFGSRVDLFLPLDTKIYVGMGQSTVGNQTVIAKLS
ncbi:MAG: phosphatidylserine decarboxylase family protein [Bacteroidales bacterium]|nr:phosphatidylserine decarboxylase family protein [Bacteroidales bacterium]